VEHADRRAHADGAFRGEEKIVCVRSAVPADSDGYIKIPLWLAPFVIHLSDAIRFVKSIIKVGRSPIDPALIAELQAELEVHLLAQASKPTQRESIEFVQAQLKGRLVSLQTIERKIVRPLHRKLWPST
jgi:hypothetical protein